MLLIIEIGIETPGELATVHRCLCADREGGAGLALRVPLSGAWGLHIEGYIGFTNKQLPIHQCINKLVQLLHNKICTRENIK